MKVLFVSLGLAALGLGACAELPPEGAIAQASYLCADQSQFSVLFTSEPREVIVGDGQTVWMPHDTATLTFQNGSTATLKWARTAAHGFLYKGPVYELRGDAQKVVLHAPDRSVACQAAPQPMAPPAAP